jgi:hypothetical protein
MEPPVIHLYCVKFRENSNDEGMYSLTWKSFEQEVFTGNIERIPIVLFVVSVRNYRTLKSLTLSNRGR